MSTDGWRLRDARTTSWREASASATAVPIVPVAPMTMIFMRDSRRLLAGIVSGRDVRQQAGMGRVPSKPRASQFARRSALGPEEPADPPEVFRRTIGGNAFNRHPKRRADRTGDVARLDALFRNRMQHG